MTERLSFKMVGGEPDILITLPGNIGCKDLEKIGREIQAALWQARRQGEQKAMAFLMGEGSGEPVGIVEQEDGSFKEFIQEFAKASKVMEAMLSIAVREFSIGEDDDRQLDTLKAAMATGGILGGCLVSPEYTVETAVRLGMPRLRDMLKWGLRARAAIGHKPRWWQWLFHNYSTNKVASFLVWRWPKFPDVVNTYDECGKAHQEEKERRVQKAYEFLQGWRKEYEDGNGHETNLD